MAHRAIELRGVGAPEGAGPGTLWSSSEGDVTLDFAGLSLPAQRRPVFTDAGDELVLNDARSGWVWTVPDGKLVPSSQDWNLDDPAQSAPETNEEEPPPVIDPRPPVAADDAFGVRPGALVSLPVLLNDHDPNEDVLAIDPASVQGLDPAFGVLSLTDDRQRFAVRVAPDASGTASFTYAVSDGTAVDGLMSQPATVTLRVVPDSENSAPVWCGVEGCQQTWPQPEVAAGGTVRMPVLGDWVDPEGDPVILLSATEDTGIGQVAATPEGTVVFQHADTGTGGDQIASITLSVGDARGAVTSKALTVRVLEDPEPTVQSFSVVDTAGSRRTIDVAPHVTGTAGELSLTSARVLDDATATATVVGGTTQFDFAATEPGSARPNSTIAAGSTSRAYSSATAMPAAPANPSERANGSSAHPVKASTMSSASPPTGTRSPRFGVLTRHAAGPWPPG